MAFTYHKPTRTYCPLCEELERTIRDLPIINTFDGKASSANNFPFHNWYNFVLGYTPDFPQYLINRFNINPTHKILDPFMGTATTNVVAKNNSIESFGVEANDYFIDVANAKMNWDVDIELLHNLANNIIAKIRRKYNEIDFGNNNDDIFANQHNGTPYTELANTRPSEIPPRYISDRPYVKLKVINEVINKTITKRYPLYAYYFFHIAFSSIIVPCSNVSYGPGFGVKKAKVDFNVLETFQNKLNRMFADLESVRNDEKRRTPFTIIHGDSRHLSDFFDENSIDFLITSPPYPGDHEYTKHTRLELMFEKKVLTKSDFRVIKKRMLVGSTTNIYKENNDRVNVEGNELITEITNEIQRRLDADGATSGFEKLYVKLVWEYFGGMAVVLREALKIMKNGGKFCLLVSDSHAFKMVHIRTAVVLKDIALRLGYSNGEIDLWQNKRSTSHDYNLREEILILTK